MTKHISQLLGAVTREISSRDFNGAPARVLVATRAYDTSMDDLWDALTNAERIPRWFLPVSGELRLGGRYQLTGNAGGEILECDPPRRFAITWEYGGQMSWVNVALNDEAAGGTLLRLEHIAHVPDEFWNRYGAGATGVGWDQTMFGLDQHFATGVVVDPKTAMAWLASEEGKAFVRQSSDAWLAASIAGGNDVAAATAAARRTTAAYLGEPEETADT